MPSNAGATDAVSLKSPRTISTPSSRSSRGTLPGWRASTRIPWPASRSLRTRQRPRKPVPPSTKTFGAGGGDSAGAACRDDVFGVPAAEAEAESHAGRACIREDLPSLREDPSARQRDPVVGAYEQVPGRAREMRDIGEDVRADLEQDVRRVREEPAVERAGPQEAELQVPDDVQPTDAPEPAGADVRREL